MSRKKTADVEAPKTPEQVRALVQRAEKGDRSTLPALRELFAAAGDAEVDAFGGRLARAAEELLIARMAKDDLAVQEALKRKLELMRIELASVDPSPLEKLLVERTVACWLQLNSEDARIAANPDPFIKVGEFHQRCRDRAHNRFLSAIKLLATVRKLALPALQINVAREQVNVIAATIE